MSEAQEEAKRLIEKQEAEEKLYGKCKKVCLIDPNDPEKGTEIVPHSPHSWEWVWTDGEWTGYMRCVNCAVMKAPQK